MYDSVVAPTEVRAEELDAEAHALVIKELEVIAAKLPPVITEACDRCGYSKLSELPEHRRSRVAQAFVRWVFPGGLTLTFCGHHADEYAAATPVVDGRVLVIDERDKINEKPSVSANKD